MHLALCLPLPIEVYGFASQLLIVRWRPQKNIFKSQNSGHENNVGKIISDTIGQGWATLLASRATLETS